MRKVIDSEFPCLSHNSYRILNPYLTSRFRCYHSPVYGATIQAMAMVAAIQSGEEGAIMAPADLHPGT